MKYVFDELISKLDTAEERMWVVGLSLEKPQTEQKVKKKKAI